MPDLRRPLTAGEIAMARSVFQDAIDYARVRVVRGSFLPFNLQDQNTAMTPRGSLYFMPAQYRIDFSREDAGGKLFFIHEMVHVWQWQLGYNCIWHGLLLALFGGYFRQRAYRYDSSVTGTPVGQLQHGAAGRTGFALFWRHATGPGLDDGQAAFFARGAGRLPAVARQC